MGIPSRIMGPTCSTSTPADSVSPKQLVPEEGGEAILLVWVVEVMIHVVGSDGNEALVL